MWKKLTETEIIQILEKIRTKYNKLINEFNKPQSIIKSFEERYLDALKRRMDISVFLLAEIEAVEELNNREFEKKMNAKEDELMKKEKPQTFADKVFKENRKKILKYPRLKLNEDADEEVERLIGALRHFLINYWPAITYIYKNNFHSHLKTKFGEYSHKLLTQYDYKGNVHVAEHYIHSLKMIPRDNKKIDYEHRFLLKETAFLINEIFHNLIDALKNENIPSPTEKLQVIGMAADDWFKRNFKGLTNRDSFEKVCNYLKNVILDFRIKDIRRNVMF